MGKSKLFLCFILFVIIQRAYALDNPSFFKGFTHMNSARYNEAIMYFNISIKANPDYLPAYSHLALCYEKKGNYSKAAETWRKYSEFDSYFKDTVITHTNLIDRFLRASEYLKANQAGEAMPLLEEIVATDKYPMSVLWVNAAKILGEIYFKAKFYDRVIDLYEKISLYYPKDVTEEILFKYAYSYQQAREFQKAIDIYKKLDEQFRIEDEEKVRRYKNMVSLCYEGLGDEAFALDEYKKAKEKYDTAIEGFPTAENIDRVNQKRQKVEEQLAFYYKTEGDTYAQMKEYSKAREYYRSILDECTTSERYKYAKDKLYKLNQMEYQYYDSGFTRFIKGDYEGCREIYTQLLKTFPKGIYSPWAQKFIGYCYANEGKFKEAISCLLKVAKDYPESKYADDALERVGVYFWSVFHDKKKAIKIFTYLYKKYPHSNNADNALYYYGLISFEEEDYQKAYYALRKLIQNYPDSNVRGKARILVERIKYEMKNQKK